MLLVFTVNKQITIGYQYSNNYWELNLLNLIKKERFWYYQVHETIFQC